jgi:hypothetical protein
MCLSFRVALMASAFVITTAGAAGAAPQAPPDPQATPEPQATP